MVEDGCGDSALSNLASCRLSTDDKTDVEAAILGHFGPQEFGQASSTSDGCTFLGTTLLQSLRDNTSLTNVLYEFLIIDILTLRQKNIIPSVGNFSTCIITLLQGCALKEFVEDFSLENFDKLELTTTFQLETFELRDLA